MEKNIKTSDNYVYHQSLNQDKCNILTQFMHNNMDNINTLLDIGCNTGALSYKYNNIIKVKGIDISKKEDLKIPNDYNFSQCDISKLKYLDIKYDVIFFLSVYHHLLGKYGVKYADNIFYMILFNSKYLLFDVGNVSETGRKEQEWYKKQVQIFNNEKQLLDHFQIPYKILGEWNVASGKRSIILFESKNIFKNLKIDGAYRRLDGGQYRDIGLIKKDNWNKYKNIFNNRDFYKLQIGSSYLFAKEINETNNTEYDNTKKAYASLNYYNIPFMVGTLFIEELNKTFIIFEWLENIKFCKKISVKNFKDVQLFTSNSKEYLIDFEV
tara:strand:+ start:2203 stop:3177 length:975 start_codon:yes stop_codon:yes gene_type:complete